MDTGKYVVSKFIEEHNHELEPLSRAHLLRSQRSIKPSQENLFFKMREAGIGPAAIYSFFRAEVGGCENMNFTQMDCNNLTQKKRVQFLKRGDAKCLLDYFKEKKKVNSSFVYSIRTDEDDRICSVFWCDAKSRIDYNFFGDVICFDTTYNTNNYNMVCAPIAGVNNHGQTVLFGCGLLVDEKTDSFIWLFNEFLEAMGGKYPKSIFTDQAQAMANAIEVVFPDTHHRLCIWHLYLNATTQLSNVFSEYENFSKDLKKCIYDPETKEEFESWWASLLVAYGLVGNEWLEGLYKVREKWAQVFGRSHFCAGMTKTQRSESVNSFLKKFFPRTIILREFMEQYDRILADRREKEVMEAKRSNAKPPLRSQWKVELQASKTYTRKIFEEFQNELVRIIDLDLQAVDVDGTIKTYNVIPLYNRDRVWTVTYEQSTQCVKCSCRRFEFIGVLCGHVLKLLRSLQWSEFPSYYYLKRWRKDASSGVVVDSSGVPIRPDLDPSLSARNSELSCITQSIVARSSLEKNIFNLAKFDLLQVKQKIDSFPISPNEVVDQDVSVDDHTATICDHEKKKEERSSQD